MHAEADPCMHACMQDGAIREKALPCNYIDTKVAIIIKVIIDCLTAILESISIFTS